MTRVCNCANPDCMANGCILERSKPAPALFPPIYLAPQDDRPFPGATFLPMPLTEADVRRIVREELTKISNAKDSS